MTITNLEQGHFCLFNRRSNISRKTLLEPSLENVLAALMSVYTMSKESDRHWYM